MDDDLIELIHQMRFITNEEHKKILQQIIEEIKGQELSNEDIVDVLSIVDSEIADDIIKTLEDDGYLTEEEGYSIDRKLIKIYEEEFIRDNKSGVLQSRLKLKTNKNPRPINRFEILGIFFSKTLNDKLLWGWESTDDELLQALVATHKELCVVRKENAIYDKQKQNMEETLLDILNRLQAQKTLNI